MIFDPHSSILFSILWEIRSFVFFLKLPSGDEWGIEINLTSNETLPRRPN